MGNIHVKLFEIDLVVKEMLFKEKIYRRWTDALTNGYFLGKKK